MATREELHDEARRLAELLGRQQRTIVFAESCTGGLISATLAEIPGISRWLCGSAVVYQEATKTAWLNVPSSILKEFGPVSAETAEAMALGVLRTTPQAAVAAAVTGHLGPQAPAEQDGLLYAAVAVREVASAMGMSLVIRSHRLERAGATATTGTGDSLRVCRQVSAATFVLAMVFSVLGGES